MSRFRFSLAGFFHDFRNKFFLKRVKPAHHTMLILQRCYPEVDWSRVDFFEGLPWFTPIIAPYVTAQAMPDFYSFSRYRIYLKKFDEYDCNCLADIVHEGFHILQAMYFMKGYGVGFLRGLMIYYNALYVSQGYRNNPFEIPAYEQEYRFREFCQHHSFSKDELNDLKKVEELVGKSSEMIFKHHAFKYKGNMLHLSGSFLLCLIVTLIRPVADVVVYLAYLLRKPFAGNDR